MKAEVRLRSDNERGLFTTEYIKKGEFICILPIDYFQLDGKWYVTSERHLNNQIDFRYGIICEVKTNETKSELENFRVFFNGNKSKCRILKKLNSFNIIGISDKNRIDDIFIGHIINDYVDMSFLTEIKYDKLSQEFSNVKVSSKLEIIKERLGLRISATENIEKDKELYLSYGSDYWKKYSKKEKFIYNVKLHMIR
jgi:hypothetical protein